MEDYRTDIFGRKTFVGDTVAFNPPYYKGITTGTVIRLTPKGISVKYIKFKDIEKTTFVFNGDFSKKED